MIQTRLPTVLTILAVVFAAVAVASPAVPSQVVPSPVVPSPAVQLPAVQLPAVPLPGPSESLKIGILGLPGAGKSTISQMLGQRGCHVLDADALGNIIDVAHDRRKRCFGLQQTVLAQKADMKIDSDNAAGLADGIQLFIG